TKQEAATKAMKITPTDLHDYNLIDDIIDEPLEGAHRKKKESAQAVKEYFLTTLEELNSMNEEERLEKRYNKLTAVGAFSE
ncbi:MAG: Acetyl-coenzyme A carboxyl transferase alpha chain (EC, partial [uncultured Campylobacterales bacterium]